jgi:8-oxo-dGTP pyrophosphatase MutT (NUDIX family)
VLNQPAGHVELNENFIEAAIRETLEETAWQFTPKFASGIYHWQHPNNDLYIRHCFVGEVSHHDPHRQLDTGIVNATWLSLDEIKQQAKRHRSPLVLKCIEDYLAGQCFPLSLYQDLRSKDSGIM